MADYKTYLAENILTEDKVVTYRLLSRALKIHVNSAKEMLFEFHRLQNAKRPGSIHATYLLSGTKRKEELFGIKTVVKKDGEDDYMQSSPFMSSSMPLPVEDTGESHVLSITLVKEENLDESKLQYEHISSIHIYSLAPHPIKDLQILTDVTRQIQLLTATEDPLENLPKYGTIINKQIRRRAGKRPPPAAATIPPPKPQLPKPTQAESKPPSKKTSTQTKPSTANDFFSKNTKTKTKPEATTANNSSNPSSKESSPNPPNLKRDNSSIFKAFAKGKPKLPRENTDSSAVASAAEDSPMGGMDDDDDEAETWVPEPSKKDKKKDVKKEDDAEVTGRKGRKATQEALRKMMEDDEDEEVVVVEKKKKKEEEEQEKEVEKVQDKKGPKKERESSEPEEEADAVAPSGRKRSRRRVMKKKTVTDEEGYLVTKEEPAWESFSEEEAPASAPKAKTHNAPTINAKPKKSTAKSVGQGNIMSFFGKK